MPIPYDLDRPDWSRRLPDALHEISGVSVDPAGGFAWAVNDEQGRLYRVDLSDGAVSADVRFAKRGDYEDVEALDGAVIVARSDGRLWRVSSDGIETKDSPLPKKCDVEGLASDPGHHRLLVACKGAFNIGGYGKHHRLVFSVGWPSLEWHPEPVYAVDRRALKDVIEAEAPAGVRPGQAKDFAPSAIAVEPESGDIYLLSSRGKMLVVLDRARGEVRAVAALRREVHAQPEGLAFDADGAMYISNEGRDAHAVLHRFDRR